MENQPASQTWDFRMGPPFSDDYIKFWDNKDITATETALAKKLLDTYQDPFPGVGEIRPVVASHGTMWRCENGLWRSISIEEITSRMAPWDCIGTVKLKNKTYENTAEIALRLLRQEPNFFASAPRGFAFGDQFLAADFINGRIAIMPLLPAHRQRHRLESVIAIAIPQAVDETSGMDSLLFGPKNTLLRTYLEGAFVGSPDAASRVLAMGQIAFCTLTQSATLFGRAVMCFGAPGTGKSQFIEIIRSLVPPSAVCCVPPQKFSDERHAGRLDGVWANVVTEVGPTPMDPTVFKAAVFGETIDAKPIYKSPREFRPVCVHVFAGNDLPQIKGVNQAVFDRWLPIKFDVQRRGTTGEIKELGKKIGTNEKQAIVEWALACGQTLLKTGRLHIPDCASDIEEVWKIESDPVAAWLDDETIPLPKVGSDWVKRSEATTRCKTWLQNNGHRPMPPRKICQRLEANGVKAVKVHSDWRVGIKFKE